MPRQFSGKGGRAKNGSSGANNDIRSFSSNITAGPFTPASLSGLQLWLDPTDDQTIDGGGNTPPAELSTWLSKAPPATTFTASSNMLWGATTQNDNPVVDGVGNVLSGNVETGPFSAWTLFMVFNLKTLVDQMVLLGSAEADPVIKFIDDSNKFALRVELDLVPQLTSSSYFADATWYQICISFNGTVCTLYVNGVGDASDSVGALTLPNDLVILGDANFNWPILDGYLGDVLLYNRALTSTEIGTVSNYLQAKWALAT